MNARVAFSWLEMINHCARCTSPVGPGEPVWRRQAYLGPGMLGGHRFGLRPHCAACRGNDAWYWEPRRCECCGREVNYRIDGRRHRRTFCCERCATIILVAEANAKARRRRAEKRGATSTCPACGETFEPGRADAKFCSAACKQKAYRRRVTDNKWGVGDAFKSRNGALLDLPERFQKGQP
jgi:hypothetical protein